MRLLTRPLPKLVAIVALQVLILLSVLAFKQYTVWTSETILLRVDTTDPRDVVGRDSLPLRYEISRVDTRDLPGDDEFDMNAYIELQEGADGIWAPVAVHDDRDRNFDGSVLMKGDTGYVYDPSRSVTHEFRYGIENAYIKEGTARVPTGPGHLIVLEVRVDRFGESTPKGFLIDGQRFAPDRE